MKSRLRLKDHALVDAHAVVEITYKGEFIAAVYGNDGPGIRIISKHPLEIITHEDTNPGDNIPLNQVEIRVKL